MFKLVAVGGKLRGKEYILEEGDNSLGRSQSCDHPLALDGVSKKHLVITVNKNSCFVEDQGSSNGTFVNGKLAKKATVKNGDKIALPNVIFQVVFVKEKKKIIKKQVVRGDEEEVDLDFKETKPNDLFGKIKYTFKHNVMKVLYNFNEQYEWNVMLGILLFLFILTNIGLTIGPILQKTKGMVYSEIKSRGVQYADEVARTNAIHLKRGDLNRIQTTFLDSLGSEGVESYELFDMEGRIIRPAKKIDTYIGGAGGGAFSARARNHYKGGGQIDKPFTDFGLDDNQIGIAKALVVSNAQGQLESVGVVAIRFKPDSIREIKVMNSSVYLEALVITGLVAVLFFGFIYYLNLRPLEELKHQTEEVMRGKRKELESTYLFKEIISLRRTINAVLQKNRELQNEDSGDFVDIEEDAPYVAILKEIMEGMEEGAIILNSEKNIEYVNERGGELTRMRESMVQGQPILEGAPNEGFAGTLIKLCDDSANNNGTNQSDFYDLGGEVPYIINVMSLIGKDNFPKAFFITFVKES